MWQIVPDLKPVETNQTLESHRLKVPGGWIVRSITSRYQAGADVSQIFVADPEHKWQLEQPKT